MGHNLWSVRLAATKALAQAVPKDDKCAIDAVVARLDHHFSFVRLAAVNALPQLVSRVSAPCVVSALHRRADDEDKSVRAAVTKVLAIAASEPKQEEVLVYL